MAEAIMAEVNRGGAIGDWVLAINLRRESEE